MKHYPLASVIAHCLGIKPKIQGRPKLSQAIACGMSNLYKHLDTVLKNMKDQDPSMCVCV